MFISSTILFLFGLAFGSFINVLAFRYHPERPIFSRVIFGRSHCRSCGKILRWYELVPVVSFFLQGGRCRSCHEKISLQYPFIEIMSGFALAFVPSAVLGAYSLALYSASQFYPFLAGLLYVSFLLAALTLIFISAVDARLQIIPNQSSALIGASGVVTVGVAYVLGVAGTNSFLGHYAIMAGFSGNIALNHLVAVAFGFVFFGAILAVTRGRGMGFGDVKLAAVLGILLGWPDIALALALAFILGSVWSILFIVRRRSDLKAQVPFGPFIALGALLVIVAGVPLVNWYFTLFP